MMAAHLITRRPLAASHFFDDSVAMARYFLCQPTHLVVACEIARTVWGVGGSLSCLSICISISGVILSCRLESIDLLAEHFGLLGLIAGHWPVQPPAG